MPRRPHALVAPLLVLAMVGCAPTTVIPPAGPPSEEAPLFASDEEALAAATEAYEEFLAVSSQILQDGGREPERLVPLVSDAVYETELEGFTEFRANGWKATGESELLETVLQQHLSGGFSATQVVIYACVSLAGTDVVTANSGESVVSSDRPEVLAFEVAFEGQPQGSIVIVDERLWSEAEFCAAD